VELADKEALSLWMDGRGDERPIPAAPGLRDRLDQIEQEMAALDLAAGRVLRDKERHVHKHRKRLMTDARTATERHIERVRRLLVDVEAARTDATAAIDAYTWAAHFPGEQSRPDDQSRYLNLGRPSETLGQLLPYRVDHAQIIGVLYEDLDKLTAVVTDRDDEHDDVDDVDRVAVWEDSPQGRLAVARKNAEVARKLEDQLQPRTQWEP